MKRLLRHGFALLAAVLCLHAQADPILFFKPAHQTTNQGNFVGLDLWIRGVDLARSIGAFDVTLQYDPAYLRFENAFLTDALGGPTDRIQQISLSMPGASPASSRIFAVSLLETSAADCVFCSGPFLADLQTDPEFQLGTLFFSWTGAPALTAVGFLDAALADGAGLNVTIGGLEGATVTVPEPGTMALLALGLLAMLGSQRRRGRRCWLALLAASGIAQAQPAGERLVAAATGQPQVKLVFIEQSGVAQTQMLPTPGVTLAEMAVADFDGDGRLDFIAASDANPAALYLYRQSAPRVFEPTALGLLDADPKAADQLQRGLPELAPDYGLGLIAADLDNDGDMDFLEAVNVGFGPGLFWIARGNAWLNDGAGQFSRLPDAFNFASIATGWTLAMSATLGDLNGDGFPDMLAAEEASGGDQPSRVYALFGQGNGRFGAPVYVFTAPHPATFMSLGDVDGDGAADALVGMDDDGDPGQVYGFFGLGNGQFMQSPFWPAFDTRPAIESGGDEPGGGKFQLADLTGDGILDAVAAPADTGPVNDTRPAAVLELYAGLGGGRFAAMPQLGEPLFINTGFAAPAPAPNALGANYLLAAAGTATLDAYRTADGSRFGAAGPAGPAAGAELSEMAVGDFDGDGDLDFIAGSTEAPSRLYLYRRNGADSFDASLIGTQADPKASYFLARGLPQQASDYGLGLLPADLDNDGDLDFLAVVNREYASGLFWPGSGVAWLNDGSGAFTPQAGAFDVSGIFAGWTIGVSSTLADLNGDGYPDLAVSALSGGGDDPSTVYLLPGLGNGRFGPPVLVLDLLVPATYLSVGDVNNDGAADILFGMDDDADPGQAYVAFGRGDGSFLPLAYPAFDANPAQEDGGDGGGSGKMQLYDVNRDGILDVVAAPLLPPDPPRSAQLRYYRGIGDGRFELAREIGSVLEATGFAAPYAPAPAPHARGDFNGDAAVDGADLRYLQRFMEPARPAMGAADPFDINRDGTVNIADLRALMRLCTVPRCGLP